MTIPPPTYHGIRAAIGVPGFGIFANMTGFAAIAREGGFDITMALATTILVWGAPGQIAMASLYLSGASLLAVFTGVALANLRMLMISISSLDILGMGRRESFLKKLLFMQITAITAWAQIGMVENKYDKAALQNYFIGFAPMIYLSGITGTAFGYYLSDVVDANILRAVLVITPVYFILMVLNAGRVINRVAAIAGGLLCPLLYPTIGAWAILVGGVIGGTAVALTAMARKEKSGGQKS